MNINKLKEFKEIGKKDPQKEYFEKIGEATTKVLDLIQAEGFTTHGKMKDVLKVCENTIDRMVAGVELKKDK